MMSAERLHSSGEGGQIRVLVVDDSAFMSFLIRKELSAEPSIEVVGIARDGLAAIAMIGQLAPDVVTLDIEMPRMDGLTALRRIMAECPVPVILLSSLTQEGAAATIRGLELGAADFVPKPDCVRAAGAASTWRDLIAKVKGAATSNLRSLQARPACMEEKPGCTAGQPRAQPATQSQPTRVVVIGTSTGGPKALTAVIPGLPADIPAAILAVQHMPAGFTRTLAGRLNEVSRLEVREAVEGDRVEAGAVLLAPGDYHMVVRRTGRISLEKTPPLHGVRPSVDVTMESAASLYGSATVGVVLTGMGRDGTSGAMSIRRAGGFVLAEHESTCVVYGMPRSAVEAGAVHRVVRLEDVADAIVDAVAPTSIGNRWAG